MISQKIHPRPLFRMLSNISLTTQEFSVVDAVEAIDVIINQGKLGSFHRTILDGFGVSVKPDEHT